MENDEYFSLYFTEDGELHFKRIQSKDEIQSEVNEHRTFIHGDVVQAGKTYFDAAASNFPRGLLIIKGRIVTPRAIETIVKMGIE